MEGRKTWLDKNGILRERKKRESIKIHERAVFIASQTSSLSIKINHPNNQKTVSDHTDKQWRKKIN